MLEKFSSASENFLLAKKKSFLDRFRRGSAASEAASSEEIQPAEAQLTEPSADTVPSVQPSVKVPAEKPTAKLSFAQRMRRALTRTGEGIGSLFLGGKAIDDELLEELETLLLMADVGMDTTANILAEITDRLNRKALKDSDALKTALSEILQAKLEPCAVPSDLS